MSYYLVSRSLGLFIAQRPIDSPIFLRFFEDVVQKNGVLYLSITLSSLLSPFFSSFVHPVLVSCIYFS
jgi:hypothetical protein